MTATAQLFKNGGSQAIRLPKQFRFPGKKVTLRRIRQGVLVTQVKDQEPPATTAAKTYLAFLRKHPGERQAMEEWESAPLTKETKPRRP